MSKFPIIFFALAAFTAPLCAQDSQMRMLPGEVIKFELPSFDEKSGYKEWELFGAKAKYFNDKKIDVSDMRLEMFETVKDGKKKAVFKSAHAEVSALDKTAQSPQTLFVTGEGFALQGNDWLWRGKEREVQMQKNVIVDFEVKDKSDAQKMRITSDNAEMSYYGDENKFSFSGNVNVKGKDFEIKCETIDTEAPKNSGAKDELSALKKINAQGKVIISQEDILAKSAIAEFSPSLGNAVLLGAPEVSHLKSGASVSGDKIEIFRNENLAVAYSSKDGRMRAKAIIAADLDGKDSLTIIYADTIKMRSLPDTNTFDFSGNVKIESSDFSASANELKAFQNKSEKNQKFAISKIVGSGKVQFVKDEKTAQADEIEIFPNQNKVVLSKRAQLKDNSRATVLNAHKIALFNAENRAEAQADERLKNSFVTVDITEAPQMLKGLSTNRKTKIRSKFLDCRWQEDKAAVFKFSDRVNIVSDDVFANCKNMDVYATKDKNGTSSIEKIEAFNDVQVRQKGSMAEAQYAKITPQVLIDGDYGKEVHTYIELLRNPQNPQIRPKMTLPELGNIGFAENSKNIKKQNTEIVSDKQIYASGSPLDSYVFEGNVEIEGSDFKAKCDKIEAQIKHAQSGASAKITRIILSGNLQLNQGQDEKKITAGRGDIMPDEEMIMLSDSPIVENRDGSTASGTRMTFKRGRKSISIENPRITLPSAKKRN